MPKYELDYTKSAIYIKRGLGEKKKLSNKYNSTYRSDYSSTYRSDYSSKTKIEAKKINIMDNFNKYRNNIKPTVLQSYKPQKKMQKNYSTSNLSSKLNNFYKNNNFQKKKDKTQETIDPPDNLDREHSFFFGQQN